MCGISAEDDSNYLNTKMKMLISKCGHRLCVVFVSSLKDLNVLAVPSCDHCIKREFQHYRELECPACGKQVKKSQLQDKTIEELKFAKETSVRKKL